MITLFCLVCFFLRVDSASQTQQQQQQQQQQQSEEDEKQQIKRIISKTDCVDINLTRCDASVSVTYSMKWCTEKEEDAQNKYYESPDPDECVGFLYDIGEPKGLFLPKNIKAKRLLGVWAWSTGYLTAAYSLDNGDDDDDNSVKSIFVSVLQVTD